MRQLFPEWRAEQTLTGFPFTQRASLTNGQRTIQKGLLTDAMLYPIGGGARIYLSGVTITHTTVTVTVGDETTEELASGNFPLVNPPDQVALTDPQDRPAGLLVSTSAQLSTLQAWGVGSWAFKPDETEFCPAACAPTPATGLQGVLLPDGTVLTGDVWLVGSDGVVLTATTLTVPGAGPNPPQTIQAIRVDIVGDPLVRRRLCSGMALFSTPQFIKTIRVTSPAGTVDVAPDALGGFQLTGNNAAASDTVLRVVTTPGGVALHAVGSTVLG